jgi:hypothetical protein
MELVEKNKQKKFEPFFSKADATTFTETSYPYLLTNLKIFINFFSIKFSKLP